MDTHEPARIVGGRRVSNPKRVTDGTTGEAAIPQTNVVQAMNTVQPAPGPQVGAVIMQGTYPPLDVAKQPPEAIGHQKDFVIPKHTHNPPPAKHHDHRINHSINQPGGRSAGQ